jgi:hypothetical protein
MPPEQPEFAADCTLYLRRGPEELIEITAIRNQEGISTLSFAHSRLGKQDSVIDLTKREAQLLVQHLWSPVILEILGMEI